MTDDTPTLLYVSIDRSGLTPRFDASPHKRMGAEEWVPIEMLDALQDASDALPEGPWEVWTSCSFRRITGPDGRDGGVLCGVTQRSDGHPDLSMSEGQLRALCDLVNGVRAALAALPAPPEGAQDEGRGE